ncbi:MAG: PBP1A family penicillin-binding protein [Roseburia sp.]|nr:PBP1A family penicillin-binding protein [Roseburia sp.]
MAGKKVKKKRQKKHPKFWFGFKIFILLMLVMILAAGIIFYVKYGRDIFRMQDEAIRLIKNSTEETFRASETSIAYNSKGKQIAVLKGDKDSYYLPVDEIPQYVKDAFIVTEDKKFYSHNGIDAGGIVRAVWVQIQNNGEITQGASTITQQLARGIFLNTEKTYERKIKEIFIAMEIEKKYNKEQILEFYLNSIYFANGYYGIEAAAKGYFSSSCKDLSLSQLCFLCAIPNNPTLYDPIEKKENTLKRRNRILDQMLEDKVITREEYELAINEDIKLNVTEPVKRNYIQTFVTYCATKKLMELNGFQFRYDLDSEKDKAAYKEQYDEAYATAQKQLLNNGYRIYTSIDLKKQKALQQAINTNLSAFTEKGTNGIYKMQGAGVCIDNDTGRVVAVVGGRSQKTSGYTLNRAYQSFRQPGSSIKPVIVYTPSLERDYTADTTVNDHKFEGGPSNANGKYSGHISLRYAVEQSKNTVAWQLFDELTPSVGLQYLLEMGFTKIDKNDYYNASSLGGLTYGCSPLEMASAYATIENDGKYREPTCIVKILDAEGNTIVSDDVDEKYIYDAKAANSMVDILKGVLTRGTGVGLSLENNMIAAGKTGTTNEKKDGWFCGFTPYYTTAVWIGCDNPTPVAGLSGASYPGRTWNTFMNAIHADLEPKNFPYEDREDEEDDDDSSSSKHSYYSSRNNSSEKKQDDDDDDEDDKPKKTKKPKATKEPEPVDPPEDDTTAADPSENQDPAVVPPDDQGAANSDDASSTSNDDTSFSQDDTTYQDENGTVQN